MYFELLLGHVSPSTVVPARQFHGILPVPSELSERPRAGRSGHTRTYVHWARFVENTEILSGEIQIAKKVVT